MTRVRRFLLFLIFAIRPVTASNFTECALASRGIPYTQTSGNRRFTARAMLPVVMAALSLSRAISQDPQDPGIDRMAQWVERLAAWEATVKPRQRPFTNLIAERHPDGSVRFAYVTPVSSMALYETARDKDGTLHPVPVSGNAGHYRLTEEGSLELQIPIGVFLLTTEENGFNVKNISNHVVQLTIRFPTTFGISPLTVEFRGYFTVQDLLDTLYTQLSEKSRQTLFEIRHNPEDSAVLRSAYRLVRDLGYRVGEKGGSVVHNQPLTSNETVDTSGALHIEPVVNVKPAVKVKKAEALPLRKAA